MNEQAERLGHLSGWFLSDSRAHGARGNGSLPIEITENDPHRVRSEAGRPRRHPRRRPVGVPPATCCVAAQAIRSGVPVRAYRCWRLMGPFRMGGVPPGFGLVYVDVAGDHHRLVKDSGHWYANVAATNRVADSRLGEFSTIRRSSAARTGRAGIFRLGSALNWLGEQLQGGQGSLSSGCYPGTPLGPPFDQRFRRRRSANASRRCRPGDTSDLHRVFHFFGKGVSCWKSSRKDRARAAARPTFAAAAAYSGLNQRKKILPNRGASRPCQNCLTVPLLAAIRSPNCNLRREPR